MVRAPLLALVLLCAACAETRTGPVHDGFARELATSGEETGPPPPYEFGPDSYRTGTFTGQGTSPVGLKCGGAAAQRTCTGFLASGVDGALLDVTLQIPHRTPPHPLVVVVHGWGGSKSSSGDIAARLLGAGYAVLRYSARGFGESWGQTNFADVHAEIADMRSLVGQLVDERRFRLDAGAVAVTGASYGGAHSWLALLTPTFLSPAGSVVRIRAAVPIATWSDALYGLVPNGRPRASLDRPGGLKLSYVNGLYLSGVRRNLARPYPNYPDYLVGWHGWVNAAEPIEGDPVLRQIEDGLAGYRSIWWRQDFWAGAAAARVPIFVVQGFTDDLFPAVEATRMLRALRAVDPAYPIAAYFGDLGHPRASNKAGEVDYVFGLVEQWLAFHVKGEGIAPPNVVRAAVTRPREEPFDPGSVITVAGWELLADGLLEAAFMESARLLNPATDPLGGFVWDPFVMEAARELRPLPVPPPSAVVGQSLAVYEVPVTRLVGTPSVLIAGEPTVSFRASTIAPRVQLNVRLFDVAPGGEKQLITRGTYTLDAGSLANSSGDVDVVIATYGNLWRVPATHTLRLEITNVDSPYITPSRIPSETTISGVRLGIPVRGG